jgi:uncharacterized protein with GYD domain
MLTASTEYSVQKITPLADGAIIWGGNTMTTYIVLLSLTDAGIKAAKDSPRRLGAAVLHLGGLGFVRTRTLKAFPETAYREIIRSLG